MSHRHRRGLRGSWYPLLALAALPVSGAAQADSASVPVPAATTEFAGHVLDAATGSPITGARVEFPDQGSLAVSDSTGAFRIGGLPVGNHGLVVAAHGYRPVVVTIALEPATPAVNIPLQAAPAAAEGRAELSGRVVDARSGAPLADARVEFIGSGRPVVSGADGAFALSAEAGTQMLRVRARGYPADAWLLELEPGMDPVEVRLEPDVVMLEGLTVVADRLERRRLSSGLSSRVMEGSELVRSTAPTMKEYLQQRFGLQPTVCGSLGNGAPGCVVVRGGPVLPRILIDDAPQLGGLDLLELYRPTDFDRVEVYGSGRMIVAYTLGYVERQARSGARGVPLLLP